MNKRKPKTKLQPKLCECGCGEYANPGYRFIYNHHKRGKNYWKSQEEPQICECGCGEYAKPGNRFITGHNNRDNDYWDPEPEPQLCECGCGEYTNPGRRFINGHQNCKTPWKPKVELQPQLCECGCGEYAKPGKRFIKGHSRKGVKVSDETRERQQIVKLGNKHALGHKCTDEALEKMSISHLGYKPSDETLEKLRIASLGNKYALGHKHTNEARKKMSIASLGHKKSDKARKNMQIGAVKRWEDPEQRILCSCRMLGIFREDWDGFGSVYCELWCEELREHIRDKYNRICFICDKTEEENGQKLDVHHVDYNKDCDCDGTECRLVPLCKSCHGKTTAGDREMWEDLIMDMLEKGE